MKKEVSSDTENITVEPTIDFVDEKDNDIITEKVETVEKTDKIEIVETAEEVETVNKDNQPEPAIQFGRTSKKSGPRKETKPDDPNTEPEKEQKTEYSLKKQSFGRSPKKRIRK